MTRIVFFAAILFPGLSSHASFAEETKHISGQRPYLASEKDYGYQLFLPSAYDASEKEKWPLIIFLHGSGERGDNLEVVKAHGPPKLVENNPNFPFIVASPQLESNEKWGPDMLNKMLSKIKKQARIDNSRIYLTGLSLGGYGTWVWANHSPQHFAAIAPVAGSSNIFNDTKPIDPCSLKGIGIWAFHGDNDTVVDPSGSFDMVQNARRCGLPARLTIYPNTGHDSWTQAYNDQALYTWFLQHHKVK